ncbi:siphovirus Gp157 family protein [Streptococcus sp. 263_SSPC]|uniref:siphovirus Gp157 family protein n=1 Tax=Streptococcus sp. 263_SSPC TaxID=1579343 RepID=UPI00065FA7C8|nr:siphovirus Gp157 family protein [Streptococcus sp. 263_SSPC]
MNLYELSLAFQDVQNMDLDPEVMKDTLDSIEDAIESKAENIAKLIRNLESDVTAYKEEEERLKTKRQATENKVKWLKTYLEDNMKLTGKTKFKSGMFNFSIQKNPASVNITDEKIIPEEFLIQQPPKVDKTSLKEILKRGIEVPGAELKQTEGLRIR